MQSIEEEGRTPNEAVEAALKRLGASKEQVRIEILEEGKGGFFGLLGTKPAKVRVTLLDESKDVAQRMLRKMLDIMQIKPEMRVRERDDKVFFDIRGAGVHTLIGKEGRILEAFQYIINLVTQKASKHARKRIILDIEGYRARRKKQLVQMAKKAAQQVERTKKRVTLSPMSSYWRHIVHEALQGHKGVVTHSEGEGEERRVVIVPKDER
jgi:spoIIIJ-associated protein